MIHRQKRSTAILASGLLAVAILGIAPYRTQAAVDLTGDYSPADNPSTAINFDFDFGNYGVLEGNEGIQEYILFNPGFDPGAPAFQDNQHTLEEGDESKVNIEIGIVSKGDMRLNGGSLLRYGHLIMGGVQEDANVNGNLGFVGSDSGIGFVTISGFGTVYNNNPDLMPSSLQFYTDPTPRPDDQGYDVYVGLTGTGDLRVLDGGRMEIGDSLFIGLGEGSIGDVLVSGFGSSIDQAGITQADLGANPNGRSPVLVGALGTGSLRIEDNGTFSAQGGLAVGGFGVAIADGNDGDFNFGANGTDDGLGSGTMEIDGHGSLLSAKRGVTIGTFFNNLDEYVNGFNKSGTVAITNSGKMVINRFSDPVTGTRGGSAGLLIGKQGNLQMDEGLIDISDELRNDGMVSGDGQISLATFSNRRDATIQVNDGEQLRVVSGGVDIQTDLTGDYYMANNGLIDVKGGEIIFQRVAFAPEDMFQNRIDIGTALLLPEAGRIHGQDATMRFRSGLNNQAVLAFTAGDNRLEGDVLNDITGSILLSGNANAVFEDDLTNLGAIELGPDGSAVTLTILGNFIGLPTSSLSLSLGGGPTGFEMSNLAVSGDILLGGELNVDLAAGGPSTLNPTPGDQFELISGTGLLDGAFATLNLPMLPNNWTWGIDTSNSDFTLVVLDIMTLGGDFNGDNFVDAADLAIWQANFGIQSGATGALGDADGDGDVDGDDYFIWLGQVGGAPMAPAALATTGQFVTSVPEPGSLALLLSLALVGCWRMRRQ